MTSRAQIAATLREIARYLWVTEPGSFRPRAYERGAAAVDAAFDLERLLDEGKVATLPGIGSSLAHVIDEVHRTGRSKLLQRLQAQVPAAVVELSSVPEISVKRARLLHETLGIADLAALRAACLDGSVLAVRGVGEKSVPRLLQAIEQHQLRRLRTTLYEAAPHGQTLERWLSELPGVSRTSIAGGLRRWDEIVTAIELVVAADDRDAVLRELHAHPEVRELEPGRLAHASGLPLRVHVVARSRFGVELALRTGTAGHVAALSARAAEVAIDLDTTSATSERELYDRLGLPLLPAEVRTGDGEVAAALAGDDFADLVRFEDLRGAVHCHTLYSDGKLSIAGMAAAAIERGLDYLTITDHSPSAHYAGGLDIEQLLAQREEIRRVEDEYGGRLAILAGTESDILPDGGLDYPDAILEELDLVIASVHARNGQDEEAMTARLVACMKHPVRKIWGHPLGRLLLRRDPIACRLDEVLDAVAATGTIIEVNGDPYRLDLPPEHLRAARRRGISFVISADAHSGRGLDALRYGAAMARRGWLRRHEVLNVRTIDEFRAAVRPAGDGEAAPRRRRAGLGNQRHQA